MSVKKERALLLIWLVVNLAVGLWIVRDYGLSYDEPHYFDYAEQSVNAFQSIGEQFTNPNTDRFNFPNYGPAFIILVETLLLSVSKYSISASNIAIWKFSYFLVFQFTGLCLYGLVKRWFTLWTAGTILVLFITQPMLWGHAFINPKDIPFLFFFTLSVWTGFAFVDVSESRTPKFDFSLISRSLLQRWKRSNREKKKHFLIFVSLLSGYCLASMIFKDRLIENLIHSFYYADTNSWMGRLMRIFAEHVSQIPVDDYVKRALNIFMQIEIIFILFFLVLLGVYFVSFISNKTFICLLKDSFSLIRKQMKFCWDQQASKLNSQYKGKKLFHWFFDPKILLAGITLGITTSIRILGPLAGIIVSIYFLVKHQGKSVPGLITYWLWAGIGMYITWPYLWPAPLSRFLESIEVMANFDWGGQVLFNGQLYRSFEIPNFYLPVLMNIQFTESLIILFYLGLGLFFWQILRKPISMDLLIYIGLGSLLPFVSFILLRSPLYDNFRQLLFILPGLFIISAFTIEFIITKLQKNWVRLSFVLLISIPGIISLTQLHPYQYIYYNSFIGGVGGAFRRFEIDYWQTSMSELAISVNEDAEYGAKIIGISSPDFLAQQLRSDLIVEKIRTPTFDLDGAYDYAMLTTRWNVD